MLSDDWSALKKLPVTQANLDRAIFCLIAASEASGVALSHAVSDGEYCLEEEVARVLAVLNSYNLIYWSPAVVLEVNRASSVAASASVTSGAKGRPT